MVICLVLLNAILKFQIKYFSEMTPIFKTVDVCLVDVGKFMQKYAKQQNIKDVGEPLSECLCLM